MTEKKKDSFYSLLIFLGVFIVVQRPPSNSQVIHLLANHFLLIFSVSIIVHNFFEAFLQIMVSSVVNWKIPFQALEFSLINKGMCQRQTLFAILLKLRQNFVYRTQMTYNKKTSLFSVQGKICFLSFCFTSSVSGIRLRLEYLSSYLITIVELSNRLPQPRRLTTVFSRTYIKV